LEGLGLYVEDCCLFSPSEPCQQLLQSAN